MSGSFCLYITNRLNLKLSVIMWVKIKIPKSTEPVKQINRAILNAQKLTEYYVESNLEQKSPGACQKALCRKLKNLQQQVILK